MTCTERGRVRQLRSREQHWTLDSPANDREPSHCERKAREEDVVHREALHPPRRGEKNSDLSDNPERPQGSNRGLAVPRVEEIDTVEGIERAVRDVHQHI